jgi:2'-5' RNA ligase
MVRAFVALEAPDPASPGRADARAHLTLKFLGEISPDLVAPLGEAIRGAIRSHPPFGVELRGVGAFPDADHPRVVWAGVGEGAAEVGELARRVDEAAATLGIRKDPRAFTPHVTLLRVRGARDREQARDWLSFGPDHSFGREEVREAILYSSELRREGAVHRALDRFPLGGERPG